MTLAAQFFSARNFNMKRADMETVEMMAQLMGVDLEAVRARIAEREHLSRIAWEQKENPNLKRSSAFHRFEEVFSYNGRQVFHNDWQGVYAVFGLKGGMKDVKTLDEAIQLVYED